MGSYLSAVSSIVTTSLVAGISALQRAALAGQQRRAGQRLIGGAEAQRIRPGRGSYREIVLPCVEVSTVSLPSATRPGHHRAAGAGEHFGFEPQQFSVGRFDAAGGDIDGGALPIAIDGQMILIFDLRQLAAVFVDIDQRRVSPADFRAAGVHRLPPLLGMSLRGDRRRAGIGLWKQLRRGGLARRLSFAIRGSFARRKMRRPWSPK